jgi:hypothetical protein
MGKAGRRLTGEQKGVELNGVKVDLPEETVELITTIAERHVKSVTDILVTAFKGHRVDKNCVQLYYSVSETNRHSWKKSKQKA